MACSTYSATFAEVTLAKTTIEQAIRPADRVIPQIADKAYDSDKLRDKLRAETLDQFCPHR